MKLTTPGQLDVLSHINAIALLLPFVLHVKYEMHTPGSRVLFLYIFVMQGSFAVVKSLLHNQIKIVLKLMLKHLNIYASFLTQAI